MKLVPSFFTLIAFLCLAGNVTAAENYELDYQAKVKNFSSKHLFNPNHFHAFREYY